MSKDKHSHVMFSTVLLILFHSLCDPVQVVLYSGVVSLASTHRSPGHNALQPIEFPWPLHAHYRLDQRPSTVPLAAVSTIQPCTEHVGGEGHRLLERAVVGGCLLALFLGVFPDGGVPKFPALQTLLPGTEPRHRPQLPLKRSGAPCRLLWQTHRKETGAECHSAGELDQGDVVVVAGALVVGQTRLVVWMDDNLLAHHDDLFSVLAIDHASIQGEVAVRVAVHH